jgi:hypothetical protein
MKYNFLAAVMIVSACFLAGWTANANAQTRRAQAAFPRNTEVQQPLYSEYRGVRLGMSAEDVRTKLGPALLKADDGDFYSFSEKETAQIAYDAEHKVKTISIDFLDAVGAPEPQAVVGAGEMESRNGSAYKLVRYPGLGFWVSYNRTAPPIHIVTITIQKM